MGTTEVDGPATGGGATHVDGPARVDGQTLDRSAPVEPEHLDLAAGFPPADRDAWVALVDGVLRRSGHPVDTPGAGVAALTRSTPDAIPVAPLYAADDAARLPDVGVPGRAPFVRGGRAAGAVPDGWDVRQRHADPDAAAVREAVLTDLANGATSIWLAVGVGGTAVADLPAALDGVHLDLAPVVLDAADPDDTARAAAAFLDLAAGLPDPARVRGTLGLDPVGRRARTGVGPDPGAVAPLAVRASREFPLVRAVVVDSLPVHVAGGSAAQELGYALAAGVAYLRVLTEAGLGVDAAAGQLEFRLAATAEQFPTIAALRAARRLWARVLQVSGADPRTAPVQHAVVSPTMYARRDPYTNLLRGTVAGLAAGVGGADAVTVFPFDAALGASTPFSRRIARNTQSVLIQESHLARVIDPAGGSWYVESLTDALARAGWAFFRRIEAAGGVMAALDSGLVADEVARVRAARERAAATRRAPVTGVSEFPDLHEKPLKERSEPRVGPDLLTSLGYRDATGAARAASAAVPDAGSAAPADAGAGARNGHGLPVYRPAAAFERHRDRSDARLAATGARPRAFLATLGPPAAYGARAGFARNLLHAGGIDTVEGAVDTAAGDPTTAFTAAATPVAVLCSTDALYGERGAAAVEALRDAGARHVLLAGAAGVPGLDGHLTAGGDALAVLDALWAVLDPGPPPAGAAGNPSPEVAR